MRALLPEPIDDPDLHEFYATGWSDTGGLRANMVASVDGAATAAGLSEGLQTPGDNRVFAVLRDLADVVLVGASTAVHENYRPIQVKERRRALGYDVRTTLAIVTRSLSIDPALPIFTEATTRTLVYTCESADADRRAALAEVADVVNAGADELDVHAVRHDLAGRGLRRILSEGGPSLLSVLARAGVVDELCLTISPLVTGPGAIRILDGEPWRHGPARLALAGLLEEDGALFARYRTSPA